MALAQKYLPLAPHAGSGSERPSVGPDGPEPVFTVLGVDPSLTATGLVLVDQYGAVLTSKVVGSPPTHGLREDRLMLIANTVNRLVHEHRPNLVCIEGTSMGQNNRASDVLAALHWLIRCGVRTIHPEATVLAVPPSTLKKWTTGVGSADKEKMKFTATQRWGVVFDDDNLCDAYCLARAGLAHLKGERVLPVRAPKKNKARKNYRAIKAKPK